LTRDGDLFVHAKDLFGEAKLLDHGNANHRRTKSAANDINQIN
jgi:hypothetical protein